MILAIFNNKGGTGKTTTAINLAYAWHKQGKKVLLIDADGQTNLTCFFGVDTSNNKSTENVLVGNTDIKEGINKTRYSNIDVLGSTPNSNYTSDVLLTQNIDTDAIVNSVKSFCNNNYDVTIIDCSPSIRRDLFMLLDIAEYIIIPVVPFLFEMKGLENLINVVKSVNAKLLGFFLCRWDNNYNSSNITMNYLEQLNNQLSNQMFNTKIYSTKCIAEAFGYGKTAHEYRPTKRSKDFERLADEIINKAKEKR